MPYKFIEDISLADVAIEIKAKTLAKLLEDAAKATTNVMVKNLKSVKQTTKKKIVLQEADPEKLLYHFLQEIIYLKDAEMLLFSKYKIKIAETKNGFNLFCEASGEKLDMNKHTLLVDVKAVTYHHFKVEKKKSGWHAFVILDI